MSSLASFETPIYVFDSQYRENELYAIHPENTKENIHRLQEAYVDPARVHRITDSTYLKRELTSNHKSIMILGGGYTYFLSKELESAHEVVKTAVAKGQLNVWGQCSGGNMLCEKITLPSSRNQTRNFRDLKPLGLLPIIADTSVYPLEKGSAGGDVVNRRISSLVTPSKDSFTSFWYRGSQYKYSAESTDGNFRSVSILAYYTDALKTTNAVTEPIAAICGTNFAGSTVIACGIHAEIVDVEIPGITSVEQKLKGDKNRQKHLQTVYQSLGVVPKMSAKL